MIPTTPIMTIAPIIRISHFKLNCAVEVCGLNDKVLYEQTLPSN
jgi:hypothetical protein